VQKLLLLVLITLPSVILAVGAPFKTGTIKVNIKNLKNQKGLVRVYLYKSGEGFPTSLGQGLLYTSNIRIKNKHAITEFSNIPFGIYAVTFYHDEDRDGKFNKNWFGSPKEGYGASNNIKRNGLPEFKDAQFILNKKKHKVVLEPKYN
jgi:uncharacterized protein (DUF2141 family)